VRQVQPGAGRVLPVVARHGMHVELRDGYEHLPFRFDCFPHRGGHAGTVEPSNQQSVNSKQLVDSQSNRQSNRRIDSQWTVNS
jgi:hypothetical protein